MKNIVPVILCGGNSSRLWSASREDMPRQFLELAGQSSMLQQTVACVSRYADPVFVCQRDHVGLVRQQMAEIGREPGAIIAEPLARNTAPAIAMAASVVQAQSSSAIMVVMPADHLLTDDKAFDEALGIAIREAKQNHLVTFGVLPTGPETEYGFIRVGENHKGAADITAFVEKPDRNRAERYLADGGYVRNSGIFVFRPSVFLEEHRRHAYDVSTAAEKACQILGEATEGCYTIDTAPYLGCHSTSVDMAVMERSDRVRCVALDAGSNDLADWQDLWEVSGKDATGNHIEGDVLAHAVDDEPNVVRALARTLRHEDISRVGVDSAAKALTRLAEEPFDLVISDLKMPDMDGIEFLELVTEFYPKPRQVIISGNAGFADLQEAVNTCAVEQFIEKPWDPDDIRALVRYAPAA